MSDEARARFWSWFARNGERLRRGFGPADSESDRGQLVDEVIDELQRYDRRLFPLIGASPDGRCELIVTAEGNEAAFPAVFELVAAAPTLEGWTFTALKPRFGDFDPLTAVSHEGVVVSLDTTRFALRTDGEKVRLAILVADHEEGERDAYAFAALQLVEGLIGEYDLATRVSRLEIFGRAQFQKAAGHEGRALVELLEAIPPSRPKEVRRLGLREE